MRVLTTLGLTAGPAQAVLFLLLLVDGALIALHLSLKIFGEPSGYTFDLGAERSYSEFMNYLELMWCAVILVVLAVRHRAAVFAIWALLCLYLLADDWLQLHERFGVTFASLYPELGAIAPHVGELGWMLGVILVFAVALLLGYRRSSAPARTLTVVLFLLFGAMAFFSAGVDAVHHILFNGPAFDVPFTTLEDGGELVVMSVITAFVFAVAFVDHRPVLGGWLARFDTTTPTGV